MGKSDDVNYAFKINPGTKVNLKDFKPDYKGAMTKEDATAHYEVYSTKLFELQELLYASGHNGVLIVLQGMDTSGKDGTIRHVMGSLNPQACSVSSFKVPTPEEASHDFLWRIHNATPPKGIISIFNRSHYEEVLVVPVHNLKPADEVKKYYDHINNFEKLLADTGTLIMKFFLHISYDEQLKRLQERELDKTKQWKLALGDYKERKLWDEYQGYYEEALSRCSTSYAPWWVVPADSKWYRNLAVAETIVEYLDPHKDSWGETLFERGKVAVQAIQEGRAQGIVPPLNNTLEKKNGKSGNGKKLL